MFQNASGVPLTAWRLCVPAITDASDLVAERLADPSMSVGNVV
jgi:hypothetical protein